MIRGACHCGNIKFELETSPEYLTECNCSVCRRLGVLWAYGDSRAISIRCDNDEIIEYIWGDKSLAFCSCANCGCTTHWKSLEKTSFPRMAVNVRMSDPELIADIKIRHFDGADSFSYID